MITHKFSIFSILKRIIEKSLNWELRKLVQFNYLQRGNVRELSDIRINATLLNGCSKNAKANKKGCCVIILDVSKAFYTVRYRHIHNTLPSLNISSNLRGIIDSLVSTNSTQFETCSRKTKHINMYWGIFQGLSLSSTLFNLA